MEASSSGAVPAFELGRLQSSRVSRQNALRVAAKSSVGGARSAETREKIDPAAGPMC